MIDFLIIIIFISDGFSATASVTTFQNRIASSHAFLHRDEFKNPNVIRRCHGIKRFSK